MALVTWKCGHSSRVIGTEKGKAKYMVCRDCYTKQLSAPAPEMTETEKIEMREKAETAAAMSEIQAR